ncbi:MAG: long-chain fatty acid--CoA ligase [Bacteroidaceae bacterium]|nr:long-chain fatty acid--CoA ligase [Bacteroidaceae bacterium]MBR3717301.1 long-chain fatty acid--CoA ligase [Bacteroidaceae bacterium]
MTIHHLSVLIHRQAEKFGDKIALKYRDYSKEQWVPISWRQFSDNVRQAASALVACGVKEFENVGIFSQNKPESFFVDFACFANRAVTVPLYATSSPEQARYIINDAHIRILFVGEQFQYDAVISVQGYCHTLEQIVIYDPTVVKDPRDKNSIYFDEFMKRGEGLPYNEVVEARTARASFDDLCNILYTSGTTGEPKGVMLHHYNWQEALRTHHERLTTMREGDVSMNFLPLTHVFERGWCYVCLNEGIQICVNLRPADIQKTIREIRPNYMCSVPRFWEKVYIAVQQKIAKESGVKKALMVNALKVGKAYNVDYLSKGLEPPTWLKLKYKFFDSTILSMLRKVVGVENGKFFPTAGAAVSDEVCEFTHAVGINMCVGYGLTESTATVSCFPMENFVIGSVGEVMPDLEVKIGENNEILLRGKTIMSGYYHKAEATAKAIDKDGWFHTGDSGYLEGRTLFLKERIKDLFKTSNGKYISPQAIETKLAVDQYFEQVAVIADRYKFVSALIVPNYKAVEAYAKSKGIRYGGMDELLLNPEIKELFQTRMDTLQQQFANYERIKRFTLLPEPFSMERGELTNTLKLRRNIVEQNYKELIDKMYQE